MNPPWCQAAGPWGTQGMWGGGNFSVSEDKVRMMARQLSPELMKVHLIAWSAAKLLPAWSKSEAWNGHMSLKKVHLQAEDCRWEKKRNVPEYISLFFATSLSLSFHKELEIGNFQWKQHATLQPEPWKCMTTVLYTTIHLALPFLTMQIGFFLLLWVVSCSFCPGRDS